MNVQNVRNPVIQIFGAVVPEKELDTILVPFRLGFLFSGIVRILPQIYIRFDEMWNMKSPLYVADNYSQNPEEYLSQFRAMLGGFLKEKNRKFIFIEAPHSVYSFKSYIVIISYSFWEIQKLSPVSTKERPPPSGRSLISI
ncbi:hypothetical protein NST58_20475 [Paenibacillus sp. FSL R10-2796]|uniref:hypothetical protein n=1 Tax=Paenibacillus TaxID=44249 RepID=UPI00096C5F8C|nr:hypothetical protein [Paenibacillus odorifer]OMD95044.1 hypothetical protein BSK64_29705 [Paenibacillus odorifer]